MAENADADSQFSKGQGLTFFCFYLKKGGGGGKRERERDKDCDGRTVSPPMALSLLLAGSGGVECQYIGIC